MTQQGFPARCGTLIGQCKVFAGNMDRPARTLEVILISLLDPDDEIVRFFDKRCGQ